MQNIFFTVLYQPLFNALIFIYNLIPDFGIAVILLSLLIRFALWPLTAKQLKTQKKLNKLQPKIKELQKKYKDDKKKLTEETIALYKAEKANPAGGCLPLLLQLPILIALYSVFRNGLVIGELSSLYSFVSAPETINSMFLGILDMSKPSLILAVIAGAFQFFQMKLTTKKTPKQEGVPDMSKMMYFFPIITVMIVKGLPSVIGVYWTITTIFSIVQTLIINKEKEDVGQKSN
jgi:YidC/Oxa1 family membrane protein insertase